MTIEQDIQRISERIELMSNRYFETREMLLADGELDDVDQSVLEDLAERLNAATTHVNTLIAQQTGEAIPGSEDAVAEGQATGGGGEPLSFDNSRFTEPFNGSIRDWAGEAGGALAPVTSAILARNSEASASISASDILGLIGLVFPASAIIPAVSACLPILNSCASAAFSGGGNSELTMAHLQDRWVTALRNFGQRPHLQSFSEFVNHWKRENSYTEDTVAPERINEFVTACSNFGKERSQGGYMPNCQDIKRAFVAKLIELTEDSFDLGSESGTADIRMSRQSTPRGYYWEIAGGQIDDASEGLLNAINLVYAGSRIIDMPVVINISISFQGGMRTTEIRRSSTTAGNTDFRLSGGGGEHERALLATFMDEQIYNRPMVSHLHVDQ